MSIVVVGSLNLDLIVSVPALPTAGETVAGTSATTAPGGKGANQAAAAAALGGDVLLVGRVGDDPAAPALLDDLRSRGVDVSGVLVTARSLTGTATVAVDPSGENLIIVAPGANSALTVADVEIDAVRTADVVLVQLEVPMPTVAAAVATAGGVVVVNTAPPQALPAAVLARVDVLVPNEGELAALAGRPGGATMSTDDLASAARSITSGNVVITLGARGALVVPADGEPILIATPTVDVVDTTGAGDCFCGALCVALAGGAALLDAARYATVAASLSTAGSGARGTLPDDAMVRSLLDAE